MVLLRCWGENNFKLILIDCKVLFYVQPEGTYLRRAYDRTWLGLLDSYSLRLPFLYAL